MKTRYTVDEIKVLGTKSMKKQLEPINKCRLLRVAMDQHLEWKSHIDKITDTKSALQNLKRLAPSHMWNHLS